MASFATRCSSSCRSDPDGSSQRGVEQPLFHRQHFARKHMNPLRQCIAVQRAGLQHAQDQHGKRAPKAFPRLGIFPIGIGSLYVNAFIKRSLGTLRSGGTLLDSDRELGSRSRSNGHRSICPQSGARLQDRRNCRSKLGSYGVGCVELARAG